MKDIFDFIVTHPLHAAPILMIGAVGLAIIIERSLALFSVYPLEGRAQFYSRIRELILQNDIQKAIALCDQYKSKPVAGIAKEGILRAHLPEEMISDGLNISVSDWVERITKRTGFLSMIANVATLMGLFGTILGLMESFRAVGFADPQQKSAILASGISTAMNATILGLAVAIVAMIFFSFLMNKTNRIISELDQSSLEIQDIIRQKSYGVDASSRLA